MQIIKREDLKLIHVKRRHIKHSHYVHPTWKDHTLCGRIITPENWSEQYERMEPTCRRCIWIVLKGKARDPISKIFNNE